MSFPARFRWVLLSRLFCNMADAIAAALRPDRPQPETFSTRRVADLSVMEHSSCTARTSSLLRETSSSSSSPRKWKYAACVERLWLVLASFSTRRRECSAARDSHVSKAMHACSSNLLLLRSSSSIVSDIPKLAEKAVARLLRCLPSRPALFSRRTCRACVYCTRAVNSTEEQRSDMSDNSSTWRACRSFESSAAPSSVMSAAPGRCERCSLLNVVLSRKMFEICCRRSLRLALAADRERK
mmetsp:Transcript_10963/g.44845  ORF Transcript_10963/g.44845 Transcript_10963/m.44845 type:complete len:241 (-) Transcript_10963:305-1027(-)